MHPGIHYEPASIQLTTDENASARIVMAIDAGHEWPIENLDIVNAYIHETYMIPQTI